MANNTEKYINKLYDNVQDKQKQMLTEAFTQGANAMDAEKQNVQQQTDTNVQRTDVEAQKNKDQFGTGRVTDVTGQQAALAQENQQKKNTQMLRTEQENADYEIDRMKKLYADQFAAAIKKAQADNDMARAQQLYEAARAKEIELNALRSKNPKVENAAYIESIYDNATESATQKAQMELAAALSELDARKRQLEQQKDADLTQTYVDALKREKNYNEVQNAYGLGSGNMAQAKLARDSGMTEDMTELRKAYIGAAANLGVQGVQAQLDTDLAMAETTAGNERAKAQEIYADALRTKQNAAKKRAGTGAGTGGGDDYTITNTPHGNFFRVGNKKLSYQQLLQMVENGTVVEEIDHEKKTITYKMANSAAGGTQKKTTPGSAKPNLMERK